jgi:serine/threonine protein kinase
MRSDMAYRGLSQHVELDRAADPRDRFMLQELIGEGTYGEVYCARDKKTGRRVAIKVSLLPTSPTRIEHHHHHQPINDPTVVAQAFLMDHT